MTGWQIDLVTFLACAAWAFGTVFLGPGALRLLGRTGRAVGSALWPWLWPERSRSPTTLYVDQERGRDLPWRTGRDPRRPLRTLAAALRRTPRIQEHRTTIKLGAGNHTLPSGKRQREAARSLFTATPEELGEAAVRGAKMRRPGEEA